MLDWLVGEGMSPHGFCLSWNPALLATHAVSDLAMGLSYIACGGVILWFGHRRPDMAPAALFWSLGVVFALCGLSHLTNVATLWVPAYEPQAFFKMITAVSSVVTMSVIAMLAPRALTIPSLAQLQQERDAHGRTAQRLARLAMAVEQNPNMIIVTDRDGTIEYVNHAFESMTGYDRAAAIGNKPSLVASGNTARWVYDNLWHSVRGQREWRGELMDRRRDGSEFWVASSVAPLRDETGQVDGFVAIQQDITDRKAVEEEMAEARRQAEIASKAKSELLANMSHELRTPLNAIIGFAEVMETGTFGPIQPPKYAEYTRDILHSGRHLLALINDVLDVSAIEAGKLTLVEERLKLGDLVEASLRMVSERAQASGVRLNVLDIPAVEVVADERRMKQVLINLLTNAVKFTPEGGDVTISAGLAADRTLSLAVTDTGIGMAPDELDLALQAFGQVESSMQRRHQGTGLGLPICMGIMDRHGGTMRLQSEKGRGTIATITLPPVRVFVG